MRKSMSTKKMPAKPGMHKMPGGMMMSDAAMGRMMNPPKKRKGAKVKKGY